MHILIGDDHLLFREGLCRLLTQLAATVTFREAGTFDEALAYARSEEEFDLVLLDLQMPGWPGFEGIQAICEIQAGTPVVIVSASESQSDVRAALDAGASGYIPKSSSVKIMLSALNLVFCGGIYLPPAALTADIPSLMPPSLMPSTPAPLAAAPAAGAPASVPPGGQGGGQGAAPQLTQRQRDVLHCLREGKSNKQIAFELGLSEGTVKIHVTAVMRTLGVRNRTQAVIASAEFLG